MWLHIVTRARSARKYESTTLYILKNDLKFKCAPFILREKGRPTFSKSGGDTPDPRLQRSGAHISIRVAPFPIHP